jgi:hypothetical protein
MPAHVDKATQSNSGQTTDKSAHACAKLVQASAAAAVTRSTHRHGTQKSVQASTSLTHTRSAFKASGNSARHSGAGLRGGGGGGRAGLRGATRPVDAHIIQAHGKVAAGTRLGLPPACRVSVGHASRRVAVSAEQETCAVAEQGHHHTHEHTAARYQAHQKTHSSWFICSWLPQPKADMGMVNLSHPSPPLESGVREARSSCWGGCLCLVGRAGGGGRHVSTRASQGQLPAAIRKAE